MPDEKEEPALQQVRERLRNEGEGLLLIYDNAIDAASVRTFLPASGAARVLLTSNAHAWRGLATPVEILVWPKDVGADFLVARAGRAGERSDIEALSEQLGGLPLAHEQAGAYCERLDVNFVEYRRRFEAAPARLLDAEKDASVDYRRGLTVAKTFALAIDEAAKLHPAAQPLIAYAALLAPNAIPLFLFSETREEFGEPLASQLAGDGLDEAIAVLRAFALVGRETIMDERNPLIKTETIRLHRLVRAVAAVRAQSEAAQQTLLQAMTAVYPEAVFSDPSVWPRARRLDALALDLARNATSPLGAVLLDRLASYCQRALGSYPKARPLFDRALAIRENTLGPEHPETASSLVNLAYLLRIHGDYGGARPLLERALAINEKALGSEHPETSTNLSHLASLFQGQGDLLSARPLAERALSIREKVFGPDHALTATTLDNLGQLLMNQHDLAGARALLMRALAIREKTLGSKHPDTAATLNTLALLLANQHDFVGARPLYERALAINEEALGPDHRTTATILNNLADLFLRQGDFADARPLLERALEIQERTLGPEHSATAVSASNLGRALLGLGDTPRAEQLFARASRWRKGARDGKPANPTFQFPLFARSSIEQLCARSPSPCRGRADGSRRFHRPEPPLDQRLRSNCCRCA
jgi:tetratricopeptide (TPR) repeat protein